MKLTLSRISHSTAKKSGINLIMARADQVHPLASGNKYYKLKPNLALAKKQGIKTLLSFGGAFSNHIHALALTAEQEGLNSIGIIRGEADYANNATLSVVTKAGMKLVFVSREEYRKRHDADYIHQLQSRYPDALIIPEGGSSQLAVAGCKELADEINQANPNQAFDYLLGASGTGATVAGLICGAREGQTVIAYSALRDETLKGRIESFVANEKCENSNYRVEQADFGGFAKLDKSLLDFVFDWHQQTGILLDPIYTSKLCRRLLQQIEAGEFKKGTIICILHSGGIQGWFGMKRNIIKKSSEADWLRLESLLNVNHCMKMESKKR